MATRNSAKKTAHAVVNARADYVLGLLGGVANTPPQPSKEAMQYYAREAAEGNPDAQYRLAKLLVEGQVLSTNNRAALKWLKKAVEKDHAASQHLLGQMYMTGRGVTRDLDRAMELFRQAAISGYAEAEYDLGCALMDGTTGHKDPYQALRWFRLAGAQGHIPSQYRVGCALAHGEGCEVDLQQAATWLRKASVNNEPRAQYEFALLFIRPDYSKHNEEEAMRWMKLSAKAGFAPAQYELAMFYQNGIGTLASYDEAFRNMDMYMLMTKEQRQAMKMKNQIASAAKNSNIVLDPTVSRYENKSGWFRPYATFENVSLDNGPKVSNVAYGSFFGAESEMYDLGHGWDGIWSVYGGYNGSHQAYDGVGIYQNGGTLGIVGMAYKGNFFTGLTANTGASVGEAQTGFGQDNFTMLMAGIASKSGYNVEFAKGKLIIQPNFTMSYSYVNTFDYHSAAGVSISSDPLHAIHLEPGIKVIGNLKNGWQPYGSVSMIWNIMDNTQFMANQVYLPELSVKPFVKYGVGVRKSWGEKFTGFFQTYITNGGRNGVGLQLGFRWMLGDKSSNKKTTSQTPQNKKVIKSMK